MAKFLSGRQKNLKLGITSYTENEVSLEVIGKVGIASATPEGSLDVGGGSNFRGSVSFGSTVTVSTGSTLNFQPDAGIYVAGVAGTIGQVLQSTGFGVTWASQDVHLVRSGISTTATAGLQSIVTPYTINSLDVFVNGVLLDFSEYTATDGANITLSDPLEGGEIVQIFTYHINDGTNPATNGPIILFSDFWNVGFNTTEPVGIFTNTNIGLFTSVPTSALDVVGDVRVTGVITASSAVFDSTGSIQIPVGNTSERPGVAVTGQIRYNTDVSSFEGYGSGSAWGSLGGVKDVDQDTYIKAESSAGSDEDALTFFTAGTEKVSIIANGNLGINSTSPTSKLDVDGDAKVSGAVTASSFDGTNARISGILTANQIVTNTGGTPSITSPNNINLNANRVSISTDVTIGRDLRVEGNSYFVGVVTFAAGTDGNIVLGDTPTDNILANANLDVDGFTELDDLNVTGVATFTNNVIFDNTGSIQIPVGTTAERLGVGVTGQIRYNTELSSFEGYGAGNAWGSLGGVKDVDQDTYIKAESSPGSDEDALTFFTAGTEKVSIIANGNLGIGSVIPSAKLDVAGDAIFKSTGSIQIPVGNTSERPGIAVTGQIRYNTQNASFEGYGPGGAWGSLGGVKDVDGDTYIKAESSAGSDEDALSFFTAGTEKVSILSNGNLGIGSLDPKSKLDIDGDARITGILTVGNSSITIDGDNNIVQVGTALTLGHTQGLQFNGQRLHASGFEVDNINASGIVTATSFFGDSAYISGNVTIGGTLTYEDVNNVDSLGIITAREGIDVLSNGITAVGIITATGFVGDGSNLTGLTGAAATTYGTNLRVPVITVDATGRITDIDTTPTNASSATTRVTSHVIAGAGQTTFNVNYTVGYVDIFLNGSKLDSTEFTATDGTTVILTDPAIANDVVEFVAYETIGVAEFDKTTRRVTTHQIAGAGQTAFSVNHVVGYVDVFLNGSKLDGTEFTSDGSQVVLTDPAVANDVIEFIAYESVGINEYDKQTRRSKSRVIAGAGQTSFNVVYTPSHENARYIDVYLNGSKLDTTEYIALDGGTVELIEGTIVNDVVEFVAFETVGIASVALALDDTPQLSANLDLHGQDIIGTGNINITGDSNVVGNYNISGVTTSGSFVGVGSLLTNLSAPNLEGSLPAIDASALLNLTGVSSDTYGSSTFIPRITVDGTGRITGIETVGFGTLPAPNLEGDLPAIDASSLLNVSGISSGVYGSFNVVPSFTFDSNGRITGITTHYTDAGSATRREVLRYVAGVGQSTFAATYTIGFADVFLNGSKLDSTEYTADDGESIVLTEPAIENDVIEIMAYRSIGIADFDKTTRRVKSKVIAGAGQTAFAVKYHVADDNGRYVDVYINGSKLDTSEYTATDGYNIYLTDGAVINDVVELVAYESIGIADYDKQTRRAKSRVIAGAGQTTFNVVYTPSHENARYIDVYLNGSKLDTTEYIALDGGTVELIDGAIINDVVEFVAFETVGIASVALSLDDTPQLSADLDLNGQDIIGTGNLSITGSSTISGDSNIGGNCNVSGINTSGSFVGIGSLLTNLSAPNLEGNLPAIDGSALLNLTGASENIHGSSTFIPRISVDANGRISGIETVGFGTLPAPNLEGDLPAIDGSALLNVSGISAGTYGAFNVVPSFTFDTKGRIVGITTHYTDAGAATRREVLRYVATQGQSTFAATYTIGFADVFLNGSKLDSTEYDASNGTSIVLTDPAVVNDVVEIMAYRSIGIADFDKTTRRRKTNITAGAGQTVFNVDYHVSDDNGRYVDVYINGAKLDTSEYTATDGSTVILNDGAIINDVVELVAYESIGIADYDKQTVRSKNVVTAGAGQTSFNISYNESPVNGKYIDVYLNGSRLDPTEYIATNGSTVELVEGAIVNDIIEFVVYETVGISSVSLHLDDSPQLGGDLDGNSKNINNLGVVTATRFEGDGSALTGVIASGTAIQVQSAGTLVGISTTINFASGVSLSNGIASIAVNIADDTTPQLGGTLDTNGNLIQFGDCSSPTNNRLQFGSSQDLEIYHDGFQSYIGADDLRIVNGSITETYAIFTNNGSVELYYDNNKKFETSGIGVTVTGNIETTGNIEATGDISAANLIVSGNVSIAGTITYDDVTHVDSIGIVTARSGIDVLTGDVTPGTDNTQDLGSASKRWANIYTGDLQLSNKGSTNDVDGTWGQFTIQEGEDDLFLINRRNGKKYKFVLQEVN